MSTKKRASAQVPMRVIGPIKINAQGLPPLEVKVPMATFESPLWPSTLRGARVTRLAGGIDVVVASSCMTRSITLETDSAACTLRISGQIKLRLPELKELVQQTSRYAKLIELHTQQVGHLLYLRFKFDTADAAGHNMATKAAQALCDWIQQQFPEIRYVSISGNYCTDKKVSAVNSILGRGKHTIADVMIPRQLLNERLQTTPEKIVDLNIKKNLIGSTIAGSTVSANAHFANILLAFYLATGQDAANIIEASQGIVHAEISAGDLYFSVTLPNLIMGTVGNGKDLDFVKENLAILGCDQPNEPGQNARKLAIICAATVLCGELSLLAAQTNPGELIRSHERLERRVKHEKQSQ